MSVNLTYTVTDAEEENKRWASNQDDKVYSFDEAIDMEGNGHYGLGLLATLSLATLAWGTDMFGFSVVVTGASCDFNLDLMQTSLLLSMAFIGPILMSYPWGYIADTQGRRKSLLISLWVSFVFSIVAAFSPNWTTLAVLKFVSTSFSSCAQSATYTLLGESCPRRRRDGYMLIMTSVLDFMLVFYIAIAYGITNLKFSYDLVFITFTPWRLLSLALASTLGLAAFGIHFFYESPKFLLNAGREREALEVLEGIWRKNGGMKEYMVKKVYLNEEGNIALANSPLWKSLWGQVVPLFKAPLLWRSMQLYFLAAIIYGTNNAYFVWFPLLSDKFFEGFSSSEGHQDGLCSLIVSAYNNGTERGACTDKVELNTVYSCLIQGLCFVAVLFGLARIAQRKRMMMIIVLLISCLCGLGAVLIPHNLISFVMFFGQLANELVIGIIFSYFVALYPTSYRGMAACLATMVARISALSGVNIFGAFVMTHCSNTFYVCSALMFCGILVTLMLPPDQVRK